MGATKITQNEAADILGLIATGGDYADEEMNKMIESDYTLTDLVRIAYPWETDPKKLAAQIDTEYCAQVN